MIYFISDLHFNHKNIIKYEKEARPFDTAEEMNEALIKNWNDTVTGADTVYVLGDVFMGGKQESLHEIMRRLNGRKILIRGNHDTNNYVKAMMPYLDGVYDMFNLKHNKQLYVLCHYPLREWHSKEHGAIHLYGHVHSNEHRNGEITEGRAYHVGVDTNQLRPVSIVEIMDKFYPCHHKNVKEEIKLCLDCGKEVQKFNVNGNPMWA